MKPELWTQTKEYDLYKPTDDVSRVLLINPGWLGEHTFSHDMVESAVDELPVAVAVVHQKPGRRTKTLHTAAKDTSRFLGVQEVDIVDHSLGHRDVWEMLEYQTEHAVDYRVRHVTAVDGVSTNGRVINHVALLEAFEMHRSKKVVARSIANFLKNPFGQTAEGIRAWVPHHSGVVDELCRRADVEMSYVFHEDDRVVPEPDDKLVNLYERRGSSVHVLPGAHLATPSEPATLSHVLNQAA